MLFLPDFPMSLSAFSPVPPEPAQEDPFAYDPALDPFVERPARS